VSASAVKPRVRAVHFTPTRGHVHSWDLSTGVDGPGTRLVVFLSGCPLRCQYCQNPDTWRLRDGTETESSELVHLMRRYQPFINAAGGGFTVSGGEPVLQTSFTKTLLEEAQGIGLHTALDTCGFLGRKADDELLDSVDLFLLDIKAGTDETHRRLTGRPIAPVRDFAERLAERGDRVWIRHVLVPGFTDDPAEIENIAAFAARLGNVEHVDVLPFHKLAAPKYETLGIPFRLAETPPPSRELVERVKGQFAEFGLVAI
jgi:pyruvate formate lyase activating enzyme